jgi:hypothetical protein
MDAIMIQSISLLPITANFALILLPIAIPVPKQPASPVLMDLQQQTEPPVPPATPLWQAVPNAQALHFAINATPIHTINSQEVHAASSAQIIQACLIAISVCIQVLPALSANQILCYRPS